MPACATPPCHAPALRAAPVLWLALILSGPASASAQGIPADIAARDAMQIQSRRQADLAAGREAHLAQQQRYETDQRQRTWYEPWIEESRLRTLEAAFFPPPPPALDSVLDDARETACPVEMIPLVGESFFMSGISALTRGVLNERQAARLGEYQRDRERQVALLRAKLADAAPLPAAARTRVLAEFAATQAAALRKLEATAESLRDELSYLDDGRALLARRDALDAGAPAGRRLYYHALLAAQFQPGLSIDQRQLLQAIAHGAVHPPPASGPAAAFFLPATARIPWPAEPAPALAAARQSFEQQRTALADELTQFVLALPEKASRSELRKRHAAFAASQAPRFEELHALAETVRGQISEPLTPGDATDPTLPTDLVLRLGPVLLRQLAFEAQTRQRIEELGRTFAPARFRLTAREGIAVIEAAPGSGDPGTNTAALNPALQDANRWLADGHHELAPLVRRTHAEIREYRDSLDATDAPALPELTARIARSFIAHQNHQRFADYRTAVLTPGLSPAQRRLLFAAALRDLERYRLSTTR